MVAFLINIFHQFSISGEVLLSKVYIYVSGYASYKWIIAVLLVAA